jgi:hypothetical protein
MKDPELTGEFVQCLRILGISRLDSSIWPLIRDVAHTGCVVGVIFVLIYIHNLRL